MTVKVIDDSISEPFSLNTLKDFCRVDLDYDGEDETLTMLGKSAREIIEGATNLTLVPKELEIETRDSCITLPYSPHGDIVSVMYNDASLSTDQFTVTGSEQKTIQMNSVSPHFFYPANGGDPVVELLSVRYGGVFKVRYMAGYTQDSIPSGLKHLVLRLADYYYTNRGSYTVSLPKDIATQARRYSRNIIL